MTTREEFEAWFFSQMQSGRNLPKADMWDAWQAAKAQYLEEAAKECDLMAKHYINTFVPTRSWTAEECAMGIRALKGE